jgi:hypothetical protein
MRVKKLLTKASVLLMLLQSQPLKQRKLQTALRKLTKRQLILLELLNKLWKNKRKPKIL